jgi:recombination protein RecA
MKRTRTKDISLHEQIQRRVSEKIETKKQDGDFGVVVSTGSTLLDLAISGGRVRGGGLPLGILVEIFGPSGCGKTVLLSEIAGNIQRNNGNVIFHDPEARLNPQFTKLFGLDFDNIDYGTPDLVTQVFKGVREWQPDDKKGSVINGIFADSLAALSTDLEMDNKEGDKMGMRRAKEFSEELRKTCRILKQKNYLMVCSNQVRVNIDAGPYGQKYVSPGGEAVGFYSSLRLRATKPEKIQNKIRIVGKEIRRPIGVRVNYEVFKSSVWKPYRVAPVTILFDYGIDDIRENLQFIKDYTKNTVYTIGGNKLDMSLEKSIAIVENDGLEITLKNEVIDLWEDIEDKFSSTRKPKKR